jgi:hypothetical protein
MINGKSILPNNQLSSKTSKTSILLVYQSKTIENRLKKMNLDLKKILIMVGLLLLATNPGIAEETDPKIAQSEDFESPRLQQFWEDAAQLVQEQLNTINRVEIALNSGNIKEVRSANSVLFLHQRKVYDFINNQYRNPQFLCQQWNQFNSNQEQVYCLLYQLTEQLKPLVPILDRRIAQLSQVETTNPIQGRSTPFPNRESPLISQSDLGVTPTPIPVIGKPLKTAVINPRLSLNPAFAPSETASFIINDNREKLFAMVSLFPNQISLTDPRKTTTDLELYDYSLAPKEIEIYRDFLQKDHRGVTLILSPDLYRTQLHQNRLNLSISERFPFAPLKAEKDGFTPHLTLQVNDDSLEIVMGVLNYGFMVNIGDISLDQLPQELDNLPNLSPEAKRFLLNYTPPTKLESIQIDQRRFLTEKAGLGTTENLVFPVSSKLPLALNQTYILRLIEYQLPEIIISKRPISRQERFYLNQMLETPSSDLLVAVRPVRRRLDGNYTVLWQVLGEFPAPQIADLDRYVVLE